MAKQPVKKDDSSKATKVRRYASIEGGMKFMLPSGAWHEILFADMAERTRTDCLFYGAGQKWQDAVYAKGKDDAPATDEEAIAIADTFRDGTLFDRTRGAGGVTMQSVAATLYKAKFHATHGKNPTADETKAWVTKALLDESSKTFATIKERYDSLKAADGIEL